MCSRLKKSLRSSLTIIVFDDHGRYIIRAHLAASGQLDSTLSRLKLLEPSDADKLGRLFHHAPTKTFEGICLPYFSKR